MYTEHTLSNVFMNANNSYELLETLEEYKKRGIKYLYLGYLTIPIETVISRIVSSSQNGYDLNEIFEQIQYEYR